jgi:hypothetical protein
MSSVLLHLGSNWLLVQLQLHASQTLCPCTASGTHVSQHWLGHSQPLQPQCTMFTIGGLAVIPTTALSLLTGAIAMHQATT